MANTNQDSIQMKFEELTTSRLILRKISQETYDHIFETLTPNEIIDFLGLSNNEDFLKEKKKYQSGFTTHNKKLAYFQLLDKESRHVIGWCGYHTWYIDHDRAEIGYGIFTDADKRKGLMSEAMSPIIQYGFTQMKLNRIEAFISPENTASIKLINKFNFVKEGHLRKHYFTNNRFEDSLVYSLIKNDD